MCLSSWQQERNLTRKMGPSRHKRAWFQAPLLGGHRMRRQATSAARHSRTGRILGISISGFVAFPAFCSADAHNGSRGARFVVGCVDCDNPMDGVSVAGRLTTVGLVVLAFALTLLPLTINPPRTPFPEILDSELLRGYCAFSPRRTFDCKRQAGIDGSLLGMVRREIWLSMDGAMNSVSLFSDGAHNLADAGAFAIALAADHYAYAPAFCKCVSCRSFKPRRLLLSATRGR
jgi:hypothetical protein